MAEASHNNLERWKVNRGAVTDSAKATEKNTKEKPGIWAPKNPRKSQDGDRSIPLRGSHPSPALWDMEVHSLEKLNPRGWRPRIPV